MCRWQLQRCLSEITECCKTSEGNLMQLSIDAARARATVGEITDAMESVFGRHVATGRLVSGAYKTEYGDMEELANVSKRVEVWTTPIACPPFNTFSFELTPPSRPNKADLKSIRTYVRPQKVCSI